MSVIDYLKKSLDERISKEGYTLYQETVIKELEDFMWDNLKRECSNMPFSQSTNIHIPSNEIHLSFNGIKLICRKK